MGKQSGIFGILMNYFSTAQKNSTVKLPSLFSRFQTEERVLRVNKSEITCGNSCNGNLFEIEGNHKSTKDEKIWF